MSQEQSQSRNDDPFSASRLLEGLDAPDHQEAYELACLKREASNLARAYIDLRDRVTRSETARSSVIDEIAAERRRQIEVEGWTAEHDDEHGNGAMAVAAACYALADIPALEVQTVKLSRLWEWTGWAAGWFKPKDKRHNLIRATALLVAEIEREDRNGR